MSHGIFPAGHTRYSVHSREKQQMEKWSVCWLATACAVFLSFCVAPPPHCLGGTPLPYQWPSSSESDALEPSSYRV